LWQEIKKLKMIIHKDMRQSNQCFTKQLSFLFIIGLLFCSTSLSAQYYYKDHRYSFNTIDSLEQILATNAPVGDDLLRIYNDLGVAYSEINKEKTREYAQKGVALAEKLGHPRSVSHNFRLLGNIYYDESKYDSAMYCYEKALGSIERMKKNKNYKDFQIDDEYSILYGTIGNLYNIQGKCHEAIEYYGKALKLFEKWDWKESQVIAYGNIGEMYSALENYEQAKINYLKADSIAPLTGDSLMTAIASGRLGKAFFYLNDYEQALQKAETARDYFLAHEEEGWHKTDILNLLADIYLQGYDDDKQAETYARQALQLSDSINLVKEKSQSLSMLSSIYLKRGQWKSAEQYALQSLAADSTEPGNTLGDYEYLSKAYSHLGNAAKADEYFDKHHELQASWSNKHYQSAIRDMEVKYETEKKETKIAALEDEKRLIIWLGVAAGAVLLLALATFFFLWRWTVQKKHLAESQIKQLEQEKQLIATQAVLDGEVQERTRLARDLHDGLGSILAAAKYNLIDIRKTLIMDEAEAERFDSSISLLDDSMREMRRVAHHLMPESLGSVGLKQSIADFCNSVPIVKFSYYGDDTRLNPNLEVMIYRIMHELVSNALKHSGASHILVEIAQNTDGVFLTVQDDGCGFDQNTQAKGMGLKNINARVAACNGNVSIHSVMGEGTEISVKFPVMN
jgi:signal transduction histidine kinase